jgi:hypothetical protein
VATELKEHHQKVLGFCHRHEELRDSRCFCAYHPDDAKCHCFTHFLDDPQCHPASVDCSSDTGNPQCMNMAVAVDTSSSDPHTAASATQTVATLTATLDPPSATSSGTNALDMSSTTATPRPVASVTSKGVNIPVIVGATVGGVIFIVLLFLAIMLCLRRRRKRAERAPSAEVKYQCSSLDIS